MIDFKACPRCRGDLTEDIDMYGKYIKCLQCGHIVTDLEIKQTALQVQQEFPPVAHKPPKHPAKPGAL